MIVPLLVAQASCAGVQHSTALPERQADETVLPPGTGRAILEAECTSCHDLGGLWAYQGYYDEALWRGLVETMIAHGAALDESEARDVVDYLVEHFGPGTR